MELFDVAMHWSIGYDGRYMPRTAQHRSDGDSVPVPWAPPIP